MRTTPDEYEVEEIEDLLNELTMAEREMEEGEVSRLYDYEQEPDLEDQYSVYSSVEGDNIRDDFVYGDHENLTLDQIDDGDEDEVDYACIEEE